MGSSAASVKREVDQDRDGDAARRGEQRNREPASLAQLADIELSPGFKPQNQEKQRHQPLIDQVTKIGGDTDTSDTDHDPRRPYRLIGVKPRRVRPQQRSDRPRQHHNRTGAVSAQKAAHRCCEDPRPRRPTPEEIGLRVAHQYANTDYVASLHQPRTTRGYRSPARPLQRSQAHSTNPRVPVVCTRRHARATPIAARRTLARRSSPRPALAIRVMRDALALSVTELSHGPINPWTRCENDITATP